MDSTAEEVTQLLVAGGLAAGQAVGREPTVLPKYNGLSDPRGTQRLGRLLAERVRRLEPSAVLVWQDPEDIALGYVVGLELAVPVIRSYDADGLVAHSGTFPPAGRIVVVTDVVRDTLVLKAMRTLVMQQGGEVVGVATLVATADHPCEVVGAASESLLAEPPEQGLQAS